MARRKRSSPEPRTSAAERSAELALERAETNLSDVESSVRSAARVADLCHIVFDEIGHAHHKMGVAEESLRRISSEDAQVIAERLRAEGGQLRTLQSAALQRCVIARREPTVVPVAVPPPAVAVPAAPTSAPSWWRRAFGDDVDFDR